MARIIRYFHLYVYFSVSFMKLLNDKYQKLTIVRTHKTLTSSSTGSKLDFDKGHAEVGLPRHFLIQRRSENSCAAFQCGNYANEYQDETCIHVYRLIGCSKKFRVVIPTSVSEKRALVNKKKNCQFNSEITSSSTSMTI